jgi:hypothetical protein
MVFVKQIKAAKFVAINSIYGATTQISDPPIPYSNHTTKAKVTCALSFVCKVR